MGLLLLADLAVRASDLRAHYTDAGLLPRAALSASGASSLHLLHGSAWFQGSLFIVAALFALALLAGCYTRLATFASCFLLISLHARNPLVLDGGDILLRVLLFWGIFLPLGSVFSVDRLRDCVPKPCPRVVSMATAALLLQVCFVYWFSALLKSAPCWRTQGTAIYYALNIDQFSTRLGKYLLAYPRLLQVLTFATFGLEAVGPTLLFVPFGRGLLRTLVVAAFLIFHLIGLNLTMELGHFAYICAVAWLALLPSWFWDRLASRRPTPPANEAQAAPLRAPLWMNAVAGFFLAYVFLWNVRTVDGERFRPLFPERLNWIGEGFGLAQMWGMFAPLPLLEDGWYIFLGTQENGNRIDLFRDGAPICWDKPDLISALYKNTRWRKYLLNLWSKDFAAQRPHYARYLCQEWNARHDGGERLEIIEIYFMLEVTLPHPPPAQPQKVLLFRESCSRAAIEERPPEHAKTDSARQGAMEVN